MLLSIGIALRPTAHPPNQNNMGMDCYIKTVKPPNKSNIGYLSQEDATENLSRTESLIQTLLTDPHGLKTC